MSDYVEANKYPILNLRDHEFPEGHPNEGVDDVLAHMTNEEIVQTVEQHIFYFEKLRAIFADLDADRYVPRSEIIFCWCKFKETSPVALAAVELLFVNTFPNSQDAPPEQPRAIVATASMSAVLDSPAYNNSIETIPSFANTATKSIDSSSSPRSSLEATREDAAEPVATDMDSATNTEDEDGAEYPYTPILTLPNELLNEIFSFLEIKDRMRARVNKRFRAVEETAKCNLKTLVIQEIPANQTEPVVTLLEKQYITIRENRPYSIDQFNQLLEFLDAKDQNKMSIDTLTIKLTGSADFHKRMYHLASKFPIKCLVVDCDNDRMVRDLKNERFFMDLVRTCEFEVFKSWDSLFISGNNLYETYKLMLDDATKLRDLKIEIVSTQWTNFYTRIGFTTDRATREYIYPAPFKMMKVKIDGYNEDWIIFFNGPIEISYYPAMYSDGMRACLLGLKSHTSEQSLLNAQSPTRTHW